VYSETLLQHFREPRNVGMMRQPDAVGEGEDGTCGDFARFHVRITGERIVEARFQTYGCGPSIAASSLLTELVRGRSVEEVERLTAGEVEQALGGLPEERRHAATLVVDAMQAAIRGYRGRRAGEAGRV
jgi:NifU-like protein involved in Fe-S cluster formation